MNELIITSAGKKEIVNAQQTGTSAIKLSHIGVGSGKCTATEAQTSLQSETKRLPIVEGGACSDAAGRDGKGVEVIDNGFRPTDDNTHNLGTAGRRWKAVYAATDVISTSDRREKRDIGEIPDAVLRAIGRVQFRQYRLKDDPLYYFGVVAQDVIQAFDDEGLDAFDYGVVFIDTLDDGSYRYSVSYRDIMVLEAERKRRFE